MTLPLAMKGRLAECLLFSYRTPARSVRHLVPASMELETRDGWAFWNVVACHVEAMRPAGAPARLGVGYHHVAYRLHVRARTAAGETLRGLYFVRSDADSGLVGGFGNWLTHFRFHRADVELSRLQPPPKAGAPPADVLTLAVQGRGRAEESDAGEADALVRVAAGADGRGAAPTPPFGSPFASPEEAAEFLKYCPLGVAVDLDGRYFELADVVRDESKWREHPVRVIEAHWNFFRRLGQDELHLERATRVEPLEYRWRLGRRLPVAQPQTPAPVTGRPARAVRAAA